MELFLSQFHLLRPYWLIALIPAFILFIFLLKRRLASARWRGIIDESLMPHVLDQMPSEQSRWPLWFVLLAWLITIIALAGPAWEKLPQPVQKKDDSLVIVLDMSLSMAAQDITPDRATRAKQKVIDILNQRNEGLTAMVVYAGDAYTVTPLTDDADTIINLVPALSPFIMPAMGSRPDKALQLANKLVIDSGLNSANFLLITDGIQQKDIKRIKKSLGPNIKRLSVLTVGTEEGAPIAMQGQGFKRDSQGNIVLPKLDLDLIKQLSSELNVPWHQMSFDDKDWQYLLADNPLTSANKNPQGSNTSNQALERQFDLWADQGYWLIAFVIVIAAFAFRRGWLLTLVFLIGFQPENSFASSLDDAWQTAWQTKDQQGQQIFNKDPATAAELFKDPDWKASSYYRAGDYEQAAEYFNVDEKAPAPEQSTAYYNRGNALAKAGALEEAKNAFEKALELDESNLDAAFNKQLVEELIQQQEEQEQQNSDDQNSDDQSSDDSNENNSENKDSDKNDSDKNDSDNQDSDNQDSNQQSDNQDSEQQDSEQQDSDNQDSQNKDQSKENDAEEKDSEEKNPDQQESEQQESQQDAQSSQTEEANDDLSREERQALEQWLNRIPDDPGGLLKRKFKYQYQQREHQNEGEVSW